MAHSGVLVWAERDGRPRLRPKKGAIERAYTETREHSVTVCLDELGPTSPGVCPGKRLVHDPHDSEGMGANLRPKGRATYDDDYSRTHGTYVFGAFIPATGAAYTAFYDKRNSESWLDFLKQVEAWIPAEKIEVVAILDNLSSHCVLEVLLFILAHPRWEFLFIPPRCAYLNLIESWWSVLRPLALKGKHLTHLEELKKAFTDATAYWNAHKHPFRWGQRRRHQPKRKPGIALKPGIPLLPTHKLIA